MKSCPKAMGGPWCMLTCLARDLGQLKLWQGQWENCLTATVSRSGCLPVYLVTSDSWFVSLVFGLAGCPLRRGGLADQRTAELFSLVGLGSAATNGVASTRPFDVDP